MYTFTQWLLLDDFYLQGVLQLLLPLSHIGKPGRSIWIAKLLLTRGEHGKVAELPLLGGRYQVEEVIGVAHLLTHVALGHIGGDADGLLGVLHGICHRPMAPPTTYQSLVVALHHGLSAHDMLHTDCESLLLQRLAEEAVNLQVTMPGLEHVTLSHVYPTVLVVPPFD